MNGNIAFQTIEFPPRIAAVFRVLRMGKHLSRYQGEDYYDLERHYKQYANIFSALGYTLVQHEQGFYYFTGDSVLRSQRMRSVTLFMLILFQDLEDNKFTHGQGSWERSLLDQSFVISKLPHFATAQRRTLMHTLGMTKENLNKQPLGFMSQLGIVELIGTDAFRFLPPVYRFVDQFLKFADDEQWSRQLEQARSEEDNDVATNIMEADEDYTDSKVINE